MPPPGPHTRRRHVITGSSRSAADRARRAGWAAGALLVVAALGLAAGLTGSASTDPWGFGTALVAMVGLRTALVRRQAMRGLDALGDATVGDRASALPVLPAAMMPAAVISAVPRLRPHDRVLVRSGDGWRSIAVRSLVDVALVEHARAREIDLWAMGRPVHTVAPDLPVRQLRRTPWSDEVWVVEGTAPVRVIRQVDLSPGRTAPRSPGETGDRAARRVIQLPPADAPHPDRRAEQARRTASGASAAERPRSSSGR